MKTEDNKEISASFEDITEIMDQGIVVFGKENLDLINKSVKQMLRLPENQVHVGMPWMDYLEVLFKEVFCVDSPTWKDRWPKSLNTYVSERRTGLSNQPGTDKLSGSTPFLIHMTG